MMTHFVVLPFFAILLTGRRIWLPVAVILATLTVDILTASRGTIVLTILGIAALFSISILRQWTSHKAVLLLLGVFLFAAVAPLAYSSLVDRFASSQTFGTDF